MKQNLILINLILIIINVTKIVDSINSETGVPVFLWSKTSDDFVNNNIFDSINRESSVNQINYNVLRDDYLSRSETIVVFLFNELCVEQFSTEDSNSLKTINSIIIDRSLEPLFLSDVSEPSHAFKGFATQDINHLRVKNGDKIVIPLKNSIVDSDQLIHDLIEAINQNVTQKVLYLITGRHNCYSNNVEESEDSHHYSRHILAENDYYEESVDNKTLRLITIGKNCLFLYMTQLTVNYYNSSTEKTDYIESYDTLRNKPVINNNVSHCWEINANNRTQTEPAVINLSFQNNSKIEIHLTIDSPYYRNKTDFWRIQEAYALLDANNTGNNVRYDLIVKDITSETLFSYSCSQLLIYSEERNKTNDEKDGKTQISLVFNSFQLQPFENPSNRNSTDPKNKYMVFAESFDCETWMTIPLWMGLLTLLLFFIILFSGIYFLSQVNTPDRFENPKGKPLMITNIDE